MKTNRIDNEEIDQGWEVVDSQESEKLFSDGTLYQTLKGQEILQLQKLQNSKNSL